MIESQLLVFALIGGAAFACQWLAWRVRLPAILFLLGAGILAGPVLHILKPDAVFGDLLFTLISLSVAIILFEGSLTLNLEEIRAQQNVVRRLILYGAAVTWVIVAVATHYLFALGWELSVLFGALTIVTGPTVIVPMLRTVRPNAVIASILRWEGILIDPIGALLVVVVYEFIVAQNKAEGLGHSLLAFTEIIAVGLVLGGIGGATLSFIFRRHWVPEYLLNLATLSFVIAAFGFADQLAHESGLLAVTVMGFLLANQKDIHIADILNFKENLTIVLISGLFILLAARLTLPEITALGWAAMFLLLVMQFLARPLSVWLSTMGSSLVWQEKCILSWVAPRGIVAAAISALVAIRLQTEGFEQAEILVPLTFIVIIGTVVTQSATAGLLARWLKVAAPNPYGFLIYGANSVARAIAKALIKQDVRVLLTDSNWDNIKSARMEGLETFYGNPMSEYADQRLELAGIGNLLALSPERSGNTVAGMYFRDEFGAGHIFTLQTSVEAKLAQKHQHGFEQRGFILFDRQMTYSKLASLLARGGEIRSTKITEEFSFEDFLQTNEGRTTLLFAVNPQGRVRVFVDEEDLVPAEGWRILSLAVAEQAG